MSVLHVLGLQRFGCFEVPTSARHIPRLALTISRHFRLTPRQEAVIGDLEQPLPRFGRCLEAHHDALREDHRRRVALLKPIAQEHLAMAQIQAGFQAVRLAEAPFQGQGPLC